ncbi:Zn(2)-C6 fungal-type domain-containing protein [Mycena indigotica]|uniref:Zn(2)-C6 fungal-type domain-containing protein n=1 Tax=Mycena indigotica TaxID=2126181 RepID=A0A8H6SIA2_9AGAR|nr:Zn(2)-C6 fungal-type domain-containing protein [Mycena indigotica]KAF7299171.1 Zn(2)-C6 fungal-type domain-containing protein [Mycena indigotica]
MSIHSEQYLDNSRQPAREKRTNRVERSCDLCRKRKVRCEDDLKVANNAHTAAVGDGFNKADNSCTNCANTGRECTYEEPARKRGPRFKELEALKKQVATLEAQLRTVQTVCSRCSRPLPRSDEGTTSVTSDSPLSSEEEEDNDNDDGQVAQKLGRLSIDPCYYGSVSNYSLANKAIAVKELVTGQHSTHPPRSLNLAPWETAAYPLQWIDYAFPEPDLLSSLVTLYFEEFHPTLPFLHRPSFERLVDDGLHLKDQQFAQLLLAVLATASFYSNDPRVLVDDHPQSSGWKFFSQIPSGGGSVDPVLYETQRYLLMTFYSIATSKPQAIWTHLGLGMRCLLQRGEHERKREQRPTPELELWNRVFWSYMCMDRLLCGSLGRPVGIHSEDIDASLPLEVDDQFWDDFVQPPTIPPLHAYLKCYSELCEILANTTRLYGAKKSKPRWEGREGVQQAVARLDSSLNKCFNSCPSYLHWEPDGALNIDLFDSRTLAFFDQSFVLYVTYHWNSVAIHRPHINKLSSLAAASLAACTTAARAIIRAADRWVRFRQRLFPPPVLSPLFVAVVVLVMGTFSNRNTSPVKDKALAERGMDMIKDSATRRQSEGRLTKILDQLRITTVDSLPRRDDSYNAQHATSAPESSANATTHMFPTTIPLQSPAPVSFIPAPSDLAGGVSIEQLLAETADLSSFEMHYDYMDIWESVPTDISDLAQWNIYLQQGFPSTA